MNKIMAEYELFRCECCLTVREESEKASCESMDINVCSDCHQEECPNIRLCQIADNF